MKVMCITLKDFPAERSPLFNNKPYVGPVEGDIVTVSTSEVIAGLFMYEFVEYPKYWYDARNFSPLSSIDETELVNQIETHGVQD